LNASSGNGERQATHCGAVRWSATEADKPDRPDDRTVGAPEPP
jgi:hypothetical protein